MISADHLAHAYWMLEEIVHADLDLARELKVSAEVLRSIDVNSEDAGQDGEQVFTGLALGVLAERVASREATANQVFPHDQGLRKHGRRPA